MPDYVSYLVQLNWPSKKKLTPGLFFRSLHPLVEDIDFDHEEDEARDPRPGNPSSGTWPSDKEVQEAEPNWD